MSHTYDADRQWTGETRSDGRELVLRRAADSGRLEAVVHPDGITFRMMSLILSDVLELLQQKK